MTETRDCGGTGSADPVIAEVREQLLSDAAEGCKPLAHVHSVVKHKSDSSIAVRQQLLLKTVRSLVEDGLMVVGRIGGETVECVELWDMSLDDSMARIYAQYVVHHDERNWVFRIWFQLTERGERAAEALESDEGIPRDRTCRCDAEPDQDRR